MLFLVFLLFHLAPETLTGAIPPLSNIFSADLTEATSTVTYPPNDRSALLFAVSRDASTCTCPPHQRSLWDIVRSCLATIFACAWVSVHPNVPSPDEKWWRKSLRRIEYLVWTLLTPELIVWWAARQWMGAREIHKQQKDHGWTITHGHFMQMGGFMLFKGKNRIGTLSYPDFCHLLEQGQIEFPDITQEEIEDRSKSDGLSKALVIAQTGWFVIQCIARKVPNLPITEIELLTLALAALNGVMYFFWWSKPFDVQCPVPVHLILATKSKVSIPAPTSNNETMDCEVSTSTTPDAMSIDESINPETCMPEPTSNQEIMSTPGVLLAGSRRKNTQLKQMYTSVLTWSGWKKVISCPMTFVSFVGKQLLEIVVSNKGFGFDRAHRDKTYDADTPGFMYVPMFYSVSVGSTDGMTAVIVIPLIGSLFGAIHCAGWAFQFPTDVELRLWQISSSFITIAPLLVFLFYASAWLAFTVLEKIEWPWLVRVSWIWLVRVVRSLLIRAGRTWLARATSAWLVRTARTWLARTAWTWLRRTGIVVLVLPLPLYILARLVLLGEAISTLRDLPPGAFDLVQWTSFLPHI